ncbi:MAG: manganese efflux pump MntP family protein [bacterium]
MNLITILFIAIGLSMDAFAVSITSGLAIKRFHVNHALKIGIFFGSFQAIMPVIGWLAGFGLRTFISGIDHWIAFGLLTVIGCKMIYESTMMKPDKRENSPLDISVLLILSIATSIDALAVGLSLSLIQVSIILPAAIIGIITFLISTAGVFIGNRFGHIFENKMEILGGLILIGIGIKILIEHTL